VRVERALERAHQVHGVLARLLNQEALLVQTNAMFPSAGAIQRQCALHHLVTEALGSCAFFGSGRIDQVSKVEVAIAHMAHDEVGNAGFLYFLYGGIDDFRQP